MVIFIFSMTRFSNNTFIILFLQREVPITNSSSPMWPLQMALGIIFTFKNLERAIKQFSLFNFYWIEQQALFSEQIIDDYLDPNCFHVLVGHKQTVLIDNTDCYNYVFIPGLVPWPTCPSQSHWSFEAGVCRGGTESHPTLHHHQPLTHSLTKVSLRWLSSWHRGRLVFRPLSLGFSWPTLSSSSWQV